MTAGHTIREYTTRVSPGTGKPYPQCQHVEHGKQCEKSVYADRLCYVHCQEAMRHRSDEERAP